MRKTLFYAALALVATLWVLTFNALYGSHPLPPRVPTHFDLGGAPDGWGGPATLWLFPAVSSILVALMTLVSYFPQSFNFPMPVTPSTRPRLESISLDMIAWIRVELPALFLLIQYAIIESARTGTNRMPAMLPVTAIVIVFGTIGWHVAAMIGAGRHYR